MKKQIYRHGELLLKQVDKLPEGAVLQEEVFKKIVAHSGTGHHHILELKDKVDMSKMKVYSWKGDTYIEVPQIAELWHQKSDKDMHTPHKIVPAIYKVVIKKHFDYFTGALARVRD